MNIEIVRAFTQLPNILATHEDLKNKIEAMEKKYDEQFRIVFEAITQLLEVDGKPKKKIGYISRSGQIWQEGPQKLNGNYKLSGLPRRRIAAKLIKTKTDVSGRSSQSEA